jgi:hypothetical protein
VEARAEKMSNAWRGRVTAVSRTRVGHHANDNYISTDNEELWGRRQIKQKAKQARRMDQDSKGTENAEVKKKKTVHWSPHTNRPRRAATVPGSNLGLDAGYSDYHHRPDGGCRNLRYVGQFLPDNTAQSQKTATFSLYSVYLENHLPGFCERKNAPPPQTHKRRAWRAEPAFCVFIRPTCILINPPPPPWCGHTTSNLPKWRDPEQCSYGHVSPTVQSGNRRRVTGTRGGCVQENHDRKLGGPDGCSSWKKTTVWRADDWTHINRGIQVIRSFTLVCSITNRDIWVKCPWILLM